MGKKIWYDDGTYFDQELGEIVEPRNSLRQNENQRRNEQEATERQREQEAAERRRREQDAADRRRREQEYNERRKRELRQKIRLIMSILFAISFIPLVFILDSQQPKPYSVGSTLFGLVISFIPFFIIKKQIGSIISFVAIIIICLAGYGFSLTLLAIGILYSTSFVLLRKYILSPYTITPAMDNILIIVGVTTIILFIGISNGWFSNLSVLQSSSTQTTQRPATQQPAAQSTVVTISNNVNTISERQYASRQLTSVTFNTPSNVTSIGNSAFRDNQLTSITIPDSVRTIGQDAFRGNRLSSITIPNSVSTIGMNAFVDNPVTSVTIGANVTLNFSGNIGILGQNTGFNGAYANNSSRAGTYTRSHTSSTEWKFNGQVISPQTTQPQVTQRQTTTPVPTASTNRLIPNPANPYFVNDFAIVLSNNTKNHINERSQKLLRDKNVQIIFTTVTSTGNLDMADYSLQMWNAWGIGDATSNNTILFIGRIMPNRWDWHLSWGHGSNIGSVGGENILNTTRRIGNDLSIYRSYDEAIRVIYDTIYNMF